MKKEILKFLSSNVKDYHGKARYLCWLVLISIVIAQYYMISFLGNRLSYGMFGIFAAMYALVLLSLYYIGKKERIRQREKLTTS